MKTVEAPGAADLIHLARTAIKRSGRRDPNHVKRLARPGIRVSTTLCATSGTVSSTPMAAAAAAKAGTPGVTV